MTSRTRLLVLAIATPLLIFVLVGGMLGVRAQSSPPQPGGEQTTEQSLRIFEDVISLVTHNYVEPVNVDKVMDGAMRGLADGLDAESAYLVPAQVRAIEAGEKLPAGDVGLDLTRQYYLRVLATREGSPAARAGLEPGDFIRAIDTKPTRDLSVYDGTRLLHGEPGTKVSLLVIRGNAADPHVVELVREQAKLVPVSGRIINGTIGYVRIPAFAAGTSETLRNQVAELAKQGATRLILDVRQSSEGDLVNGLAAAGLFVPSGATVAMKTTRDVQKAPVKNETPGQTITLPAVVLTDFGTAGPGELFAAALAGNDRAKTVGEHTVGRAGLQKLVKLPQGYGIWLTYSTFTTPKGDVIHEKGIVPNVTVDVPEREFGKAPDPATKDLILEKAIEVLGA
jgi:carboxyl-terminal processing protease